MAGKHRFARRWLPRATPNRATRAQPLWVIEVVDTQTLAAHLVTADALAAGRGTQGRYVAVCGVELLDGSLPAPPQGRCRSCAVVPLRSTNATANFTEGELTMGVELGRHADAVPLLSTALKDLPDCYERDQARYAAQLALASAGAGDADGALVVAMRAAELAAATGSALATRELHRVRAAMRERGADAQAAALAKHVRQSVPPHSAGSAGLSVA